MMKSSPIEELRRRGIQITAQRLAVLAAVRQKPHATAEAIAAAVREQLGAISRQAVYDTLGLLVEAGLVRRIQPAGSPARFETRTGDNHHHLICRACGRVEDVDCALGAAPCLAPSDSRGYRVEEAEVVYWGVCPTCQEAQLASPPVAVKGGNSTRNHAGDTSSPSPAKLSKRKE